ncbi:MAG: cryptochrome/photolyase family protein [Myxococcota bacterium]
MTRSLAFLGPWDLHPDLSALAEGPDTVEVLLVRSIAKGASLRWHRQKLVLVLSAMQHFAEELRALGYRVHERTAPSYVAAIEQQLAEASYEALHVMQPKEWGLDQALRKAQFSVPVVWHEDSGAAGHFLISREDFATWASTQKGPQLRMDVFYRWMRKRFEILLSDSGGPLGGKWSFDADNRKPARGVRPPLRVRPQPDAVTRGVMDEVAGWSHAWGMSEPFSWPVTREDARAELQQFVRHRLQDFGAFQDAMLNDEPFMWHAWLSTSLNLGLLRPMEVIEAVVAAGAAGDAPLNSVEGLVRQILGWREFMRGVYWLRMPDLRAANLLQADRPLPAFYWDSRKTDMQCLKEAVRAVEAYGYAHHIQRLMVLGNFALLAGVRPLEISHWFWAGFVDAFEWVELPNVHGMAVFADDTFTTKPYAASGNYIHKMSDHCKGCRYRVKEKFGEDACPFNPLFWRFMVLHRERLSQNFRLKRLYATWDRKSESDREATLASAEAFLASLVPAPAGMEFLDDAC